MAELCNEILYTINGNYKSLRYDFLLILGKEYFVSQKTQFNLYKLIYQQINSKKIRSDPTIMRNISNDLLVILTRLFFDSQYNLGYFTCKYKDQVNYRQNFLLIMRHRKLRIYAVIIKEFTDIKLYFFYKKCEDFDFIPTWDEYNLLKRKMLSLENNSYLSKTHLNEDILGIIMDFLYI